MSDALSDIAADQKRSQRINEYELKLVKFLKNTNEETKQAVIDAAQKVDDVSGGYWGRPTDLKKNLEDRLDKLKNGDKEEWIKLLCRSMESMNFGKLKSLSPFAGKFIVLVNYGIDFARLKVDPTEKSLEALVDGFIRDGKNWKTYDCDKYAVVLQKPEPMKTNDTEVFWLGCGILNIKGPRKHRE